MVLNVPSCIEFVCDVSFMSFGKLLFLLLSDDRLGYKLSTFSLFGLYLVLVHSLNNFLSCHTKASGQKKSPLRLQKTRTSGNHRVSPKKNVMNVQNLPEFSVFSHRISFVLPMKNLLTWNKFHKGSIITCINFQNMRQYSELSLISLY